MSASGRERLLLGVLAFRIEVMLKVVRWGGRLTGIRLPTLDVSGDSGEQNGAVLIVFVSNDGGGCILLKKLGKLG